MTEFRFLTMQEFSRLTRLEKARYLVEAAAEIEEAKGVAEYSLFKDGPPLPETGDVTGS